VQEAKYRQLRLAPKPNPKVQANVLDVPGALDFLAACGFEVHTEQQRGDTEAESCAYFLDDAKLSYVEAGIIQLQTAMSAAAAPNNQQQQHTQQSAGAAVPSAASGAAGAVATSPPGVGFSGTAAAGGGAAGTAAAAAGAAATVAPAVDRKTLVLLPAAPDTEVPEWFFQRTAAEVKAEFMSLLRQRQTREVLASKAWKDLRMGASNSSSSRSSVITLRVRFPEVRGACCTTHQQAAVAI
jgi:hypothetical protein